MGTTLAVSQQVRSAPFCAPIWAGICHGVRPRSHTALVYLEISSITFSDFLAEASTRESETYPSRLAITPITEPRVATVALRTSPSELFVRVTPPFGLLISVLAGLVSGGAFFYLRKHFDRTLKTPAEVSRRLQLPCLGLVPDFTSKAVRVKGMVPLPPEFETFPGVFSKELLLAYHPLSLIPEAYRTLRTKLLLTRVAGPLHSLLFTSGKIGEGKTITALNTAISLARMGARVLVIDADLRHPNCHTILKMAKGRGLTEFLTGQHDLEEVIQTTRVERLFFLDSGAPPSKPAELLGSKKMREALSLLCNSYDYVIVDSPPLDLMNGVALLSSITDGVVLVVDSQQTPYSVVQDARARLSVQANVLGVVLNKVDAHSREYKEFAQRYRASYQQDETNQVTSPLILKAKKDLTEEKKRNEPTFPDRIPSGLSQEKEETAKKEVAPDECHPDGVASISATKCSKGRATATKTKKEKSTRGARSRTLTTADKKAPKKRKKNEGQLLPQGMQSMSD